MAAASAPTYRRLAFGDVSSTNTIALEAARSGDAGDLWVTAERQIEGRGRMGRRWSSEAGNLFASWMGIDVTPAHELAKLPFVAALAVRNAIERFVEPGARVQTKWPNDILVDGKKIVGILLETSRLTTGHTVLVLGCGINVDHHPEDAPYPVTSLRAEGYRSGTQDVFEALALEWQCQLKRFDRGANFGEIRRDWLSHAVGIGGPCTARLTDRTLEGRFEAIDADGRLLLALADGRIIPISAGDIFFSSSAP
ncbi:biotin--[acetyl-CoA-carboxylase] ligase [Fulvimarina endophytica]|uniref:biotin--[biotin carboxyl-carrier protein] ligase n=1 Tax=Fulvimarina endophytica TaxID=2293836 RepID=A0A371X7Q4_9HYPH|nr:biotin--[acetyl-CoA-carboxylase] ligase [Fulvimarina endophytica]RFC65253.1 biotin--[acetyl-CoA-carboxylase] ligase [Fulvimarina endophytica]